MPGESITEAFAWRPRLRKGPRVSGKAKHVGRRSRRVTRLVLTASSFCHGPMGAHANTQGFNAPASDFASWCQSYVGVISPQFNTFRAKIFCSTGFHQNQERNVTMCLVRVKVSSLVHSVTAFIIPFSDRRSLEFKFYSPVEAWLSAPSSLSFTADHSDT